MASFFDSHSNKIAVIPGYLIFIGFIYKHSYYTQFDIAILNYLTPGELILSFLEVSIPLLTLVASFSFMYLWYNSIVLNFGYYSIYAISEVKEILEGGTEKSRQLPEQEKKINPESMQVLGAIPWTYRSLKFAIKQGWKNWFNILLRLILFMVSMGVFFFQFIFPVYFIFGLTGSLSYEYFNTAILIITSLIWLAYLEFSDRLSIPALSRFDHLLLIFNLILIGIIWQYNVEKSSSIYEGEVQTTAEFSTNSKIVSTTSDLLYLGSTENYLFLFDRCDSTSFIYKMSEIHQLSIKMKN